MQHPPRSHIMIKWKHWDSYDEEQQTETKMGNGWDWFGFVSFRGHIVDDGMVYGVEWNGS